MKCDVLRLQPQTTGCWFEVEVFHFGERSGPHAYIQAGLHADEIPGLLLATELITRLRQLEDQGAIRGKVTLVPFANPIGLSQRVLGEPQGRFDLASGGNFNRGFTDFASDVRRLLMTRDPAKRSSEVGAAFDTVLDRHPPSDIVEELQQLLVRLSSEADTILDLHSNHDGELFLYAPALCADDAQVLARLIGAEIVILTSRKDSDATFEDVSILPRIKIGENFLGQASPRFVATVELRGQRDVSEDFARRDAEAILMFLQERGSLTSPVPGPLNDDNAKPLMVAETDVLPVVAPLPGVLLFATELGALVRQDEVVAVLVEPGSGSRHELRAPVQGRVFSRTGTRYAIRGVEVVRIAKTQVP